MATRFCERVNFSMQSRLAKILSYVILLVLFVTSRNDLVALDVDSRIFIEASDDLLVTIFTIVKTFS
jgi:hypothetical protein